MRRYLLIPLMALSTLAFAQKPCVVTGPTATFTIRHVDGSPELSLDPDASVWKNAASQSMSKDCTKEIDYPNLKSTIRAFWTDTDLYILFQCPYTELNLFLPPDNTVERVGLWDRDVVEMFLGDDWTNIRHYREFEIAPTGDWIDLAIDLDHNSYDHNWQSGWKTAARIDKERKIWYAAARIPLTAVSGKPVISRHKMACQPIPDRRARRGSAAPFHVLAADLRPESGSQPRSRTLRHSNFQ